MQINWPDLTFDAVNLWNAPNTYKSPWIGVCKLLDGVCIGCYRTIEEIELCGKASMSAEVKFDDD